LLTKKLVLNKSKKGNLSYHNPKNLITLGFLNLTTQKKRLYMLHITTPSKTGKLNGIPPINTSVLNNKFCSKMRDSDAVCNECYASRIEQRYTNLHLAIEKNDTVLSDSIIPIQYLPIFNNLAIRFHSLGELINTTHLHNFLNIAEKNPQVIFSLWSKRKDIINKVLSKRAKPINFILIYSTTLIDKISKLPKYFNKVFSVHSKGSQAAINCHGACKTCMLCYSHNDTIYINEIVK